MQLQEMMVQQFGIKECQMAKTLEDVSRLCRQFDPIAISKYFKRKHFASVGKYKMDQDIHYPTEPWIENGSIIGIIVMEEKEKFYESTISRECCGKWKFRFNDMLDVCLNISMFAAN